MATTQSNIVNPTPKTRFLKNEAIVKKHNDMVFSDTFQNSLDFALMEFQAQLALEKSDGPNFFNECAAAHLRFKGALQFVNTLKTLGRVPEQAPARIDGNLDHGVK